MDRKTSTRNQASRTMGRMAPNTTPPPARRRSTRPATARFYADPYMDTPTPPTPPRGPHGDSERPLYDRDAQRQWDLDQAKREGNRLRALARTGTFTPTRGRVRVGVYDSPAPNDGDEDGEVTPF